MPSSDDQESDRRLLHIFEGDRGRPAHALIEESRKARVAQAEAQLYQFSPRNVIAKEIEPFSDQANVKDETLIIPENITKWPGKLKSKVSLPVFFREVWGIYISRGLTMSLIRREDRKLYNALYSWRNYEKLPWPDDLSIPDNQSKLEDNVRRFRANGGKGLTPKEMVAVARALTRDSTRGISDRQRADRAPKNPRRTKEKSYNP